MIPAILIVVALVALIFTFTLALYYAMPWLLKMEAAYWGRRIEEEGAALQSANDDEVVLDDTEPDFV